MENNTNVKTSLNNVEIYGMECIFNKTYEYTFGYDTNEEFFISCDNLNSTSSANGMPLEIEKGIFLSHLLLQNNGMVITVCYDKEDNVIYYRTEENNSFYRLNDYIPVYSK